MKKATSVLFFLALVVLFIQILIGFPIKIDFLEEKSEKKIDQNNSQTDGAEQVMQGVHLLVESSAGARDWELFAKAADGYQGKGVWELQNVKLLFYNQNKVDFTVTGESGQIDTKTKDMEVRGRVVMSSVNGYEFRSDKVEYKADLRKITSPSSISMTGPDDESNKGIQVQANRMVTWVGDSRMQIMGNVIAKKELSQGKMMQIYSEDAEFSGKNRQVKFSNKVTMEVDSMRVEGPEAEFNYNEANLLKSVVIKGGVRASDQDKMSTSDAVIFDPLKNHYLLTGKPKVLQEDDEIIGDQILLIDGGRKVKVENMKAKVGDQ